jgi:predicted TIM-barrel fold metal-dependent hydrolase
MPVYSDFDRLIWETELADFVPDRMVDSHVHVWSERFAGMHSDPSFVLRLEAGIEDVHTWSNTIFPGRLMGYVVLPSPMAGIDREGHNRWVSEQVDRGWSGGFGRQQEPPICLQKAMLVWPGMDATHMEQYAIQTDTRIVKPYRVYASDPANASIADFLPEVLMEVAEALHMSVVLHLSKLSGPADPANVADVKGYAEAFPHITWILAHCMRAFNSCHLEQVVRSYAAIPSVWVDTSAVNDPHTHWLLFKYFDRNRIMFGSDNISAGSWRGKYITFGHGWKGFCQEDPLEHCRNDATLVVYEQLRAQRQAALMAGLSRVEIEDVFYGNAVSLFGCAGTRCPTTLS